MSMIHKAQRLEFQSRSNLALSRNLRAGRGAKYRTAGSIGIHSSQIDTIKQVKKLRAKLNPKLLPDRKQLAEHKVGVRIPGPPNGVATNVTSASQRRIGKRSLIEVANIDLVRTVSPGDPPIDSWYGVCPVLTCSLPGRK